MKNGVIKRINLAMQGGGAHGALLWGILDALLEDDKIEFDSISATSAGAINATILAHGLANGGKKGAREALRTFWETVSNISNSYQWMKMTPLESLLGTKTENSVSYMIFDQLNKLFSPYQLNPLNINPLRDLIKKTVDFKKINDSSELQLFISATNVKTGKIRVFTNNEINLDSVMASACLPFLFQAVKIKDDYYWDGGYMGNPAIFPLFYHSKCRDILILHINPIYRENVPNTTTEILNRVNEISFNSSLMREMRAVSFINKLLDENWIKDEYKDQIHRYYMHAIRADVTMQSFSMASKMNTDWDFINQLYTEGRNQGIAWLETHQKDIGKKTSIDMSEYL